MKRFAVALLLVLPQLAAVGCSRRPPRSSADLVSSLRGADEDDRRDAAKDFRKHADPPKDALPHVFAALQAEREPEVYGELLLTLGHWGTPAAQPYIEGALAHPDEDLREFGEKALKLWADRNPGRGPLPPGQAIAPPAVTMDAKRVMPPWNIARVDGQVPECWRDGSGKRICGFNCVVDGGRVGCASTPYGHCSNAGGEVRCVDGPSVTVLGVGQAPQQKAPECKMGSDGMNACGYNCQLGSNGKAYCSSVPNGNCARNADGTFTCP